MSIINDLKYTINSGANSSKFVITIPVPVLLRGVAKINNLVQKIPLIGTSINAGVTSIPSDGEISILAKSTTLPEKMLNTVDIWHRGHKYIVRGPASFTHKWDVTFYNTADLNLRKFFEGWIYEIDKFDNVFNIGPIGPTTFPSNYMGIGTLNSGYMTDLKVHQLCNGDRTAGYEFSYAFPINVSSTELNASTTNTISEFTVTFAYSFWKPASSDAILHKVADKVSKIITNPSSLFLNSALV
jgi:hypothetical protein